jgi:hypothetical protein
VSVAFAVELTGLGSPLLALNLLLATFSTQAFSSIASDLGDASLAPVLLSVVEEVELDFLGVVVASKSLISSFCVLREYGTGNRLGVCT